MTAATPAEWVSGLLLGVGVWASYCTVHFVFVGASRADFPRLWQAAVHARRDADWVYASALHHVAVAVLFARLAALDVADRARSAARRAALSAAVLLLLLSTPEATR